MNDEQIIYQVNSSLLDFEARVENGANPKEALQWLRRELKQINEGVFLHEEN